MGVMIPNKVARFFMAHGVYIVTSVLHRINSVARWLLVVVRQTQTLFLLQGQ